MEQITHFKEPPVQAKKSMDQAARERRDAHICALHRELYYLWDFIGEDGLWSEAKEYVDECCDDPIPYEW